MKLKVLVGGEEIALDHPGADLKEVEPGVYSVLWRGRSFEARIYREAGNETGTYAVDLEGRRFAARVHDPRNASRGAKASLAGGRQNITSVMPGKVVRVLVEEGEQVEAGRPLIVVEAMKMQNEMKAGKPGRIVKVLVRAGDTVRAGETLVSIE
jgi:biotin carboxyl carrier protein